MTGEVIAERQGQALTLTLSNPAKRNSIDMGMYDVLEQELLTAAEDSSLKAVILQGSGQSFAGGTDIAHLESIETGQQGVEYEAHMARVQKALIALRIPVISVVRGPCVGGGLVLAALSDLVFCVPSSRFGSPIARTLGNTLSATSIARLNQCFGRRTTAEMLLTARLFSAEEAERRGFVTAVVEEENLDEYVNQVLDSIRAAAPLTIWSIKEFQGRIDQHAAKVEVDDVYAKVYQSADFREGVQSFLGKRKPEFTGE